MTSNDVCTPDMCPARNTSSKLKVGLLHVGPISIALNTICKCCGLQPLFPSGHTGKQVGLENAYC